MRPSPWSLALVMLILGGALCYFAREQPGVVLPTTYAVAAGLGAGALLLLTRKPFAYWVALAGGAFTIAVAVAAIALHRELVPTPIITVFMGALVCARVLLARMFERRALEREAERQSEQSLPSES